MIHRGMLFGRFKMGMEMVVKTEAHHPEVDIRRRCLEQEVPKVEQVPTSVKQETILLPTNHPTRKRRPRRRLCQELPKRSSKHPTWQNRHHSIEEKVPNSDEDDEPVDGVDDERDADYGSVVAEPKKKQLKRITKGKDLEKKKWLHGKGGVKRILPPTNLLSDPPEGAVSVTVNGKSKRDADGESESSQTLSSPN